MAKVSVIIPVYNVEKYLHKTLDSVINQTLKDIEIICVDDCSSDNSFDILEQYRKKDSRIKIIKNSKNQGVGAARNIGMDFATGDYIMFLDSDDWYENVAIEKCYNQAENNQNDIIIFGHNRFYSATGEIKYNNDFLKPFRNWINFTSVNLDKINSNSIGQCFVWSLIYRRKFIIENNLRFMHINTFEDQSFYVKSLMLSKSVSFIDYPLYNYRIRRGSLTFCYKNQHEDFLNAKRDILENIHLLSPTGNLKRSIYINTIQASLYWYSRYSKEYPDISEKFFQCIKEIFLMLDQDYVQSNIRPLLKPGVYKKYIKILKNDYNSCKGIVSENSQLQNILSIKNSSDRKYKIITILGLKIKLNKVKLLLSSN